MPEAYQRESGEPAVSSVVETRPDHDTEWSAIRHVATRFNLVQFMVLCRFDVA